MFDDERNKLSLSLVQDGTDDFQRASRRSKAFPPEVQGKPENQQTTNFLKKKSSVSK
jgi:hypothetical protein